jgi:disease resistance protein RPM1
MWKAPLGISRMKELREVSKVLITDNVDVARQIGDLEHLRGMFVYLDDTSEHYETVREELARSLCKVYSLRWLNVGEVGNNHYTLDYLMDLPSPPQLLRYLRFAGGLSKLPDWVGSLTYLSEFCMSWGRLRDDQLFSVLCKAPNLKSILLQECFYRDDELVARTSHNFPALEEMRVTCYTAFPRVIRFEQGSMEKLKTLEVNFGDHERSILGIEHLRNLKEVQLAGNKYKSALNITVNRLEEEIDSRSEDNQFVVRVRYY